MAKVVTLHGARWGGWSRDRWAWIGAVAADGQLTPLARLVAVVLAQGFANHETAECRPGLAALMAKVAAPKRTVMRALSDLQARGWIDRRGGNAPGQLASYVFRRPEQVPEMTSEQVPEMTPEQVPNLTSTGANFCKSPCTPYKDKPQLNHNARPTPRQAIRGLVQQPHCMLTTIAPGSLAFDRWNDWLRAEGFQPLDKIGWLVDGGFRMPVTVAPSERETVPYGIARRWAEWLRSRA